ncbi:MAG: isoprenylcysteine carboxylmethyltransferase family protein [Patescibacteria group bacterium]|nr:isoprenylcysteine carboxylmethyltransferase family protein [Patescibacteria group bacterium]
MQYADWISVATAWMWVIFIAVWAASALFAKKTAKRASLRWWLVRIIFIPIVIILARISGMKPGSFLLLYIEDPALRAIGAVLVLSGIALAIWARYHLGRNWGMPMSEKADAELVTTGPYAYIRHPIYAGIFLAVLGSALVFGILWVLVLAIYVGYFLVSVRKEDEIMARLFPDAYPAYKARTKKVIPGVW